MATLPFYVVIGDAHHRGYIAGPETFNSHYGKLKISSIAGGPFQVDDVLTGATSGFTATVRFVDTAADILYVDILTSTSAPWPQFDETVTGSVSAATAKVGAGSSTNEILSEQWYFHAPKVHTYLYEKRRADVVPAVGSGILPTIASWYDSQAPTAVLPYDTLGTAFTVGETITGALSGATAVVDVIADRGDGTGELHISSIVGGPFQIAEVITGSVSGVAVSQGTGSEPGRWVVYHPLPDFGGFTGTPLPLTPENKRTWGSNHQEPIPNGVGPDVGLMPELASKHPLGCHVLKFGTLNGAIGRGDMTYSSRTSAFNVGATVTGTTSGATATIIADVDGGGGTGTLTLERGNGLAFIPTELLIDDGGAPGGATCDTNTLAWFKGGQYWEDFDTFLTKGIERYNVGTETAGNSLEPTTGGIISLVMEGDVLNALGGFNTTTLQQWVDDLRSLIISKTGSASAKEDVPFLQMKPSSESHGTGLPLSAAAFRDVLNGWVRDNDLVGFWDMAGAKFSEQSPLGTAVPGAEAWMAPDEYFEMGPLIRNALDRITANVSPPLGSGAIVVHLCGQSQVGGFVAPLLLQSDLDPRVLFTTSVFAGQPFPQIDPNRVIWNAQTQQWEAYDIYANTNTIQQAGNPGNFTTGTNGHVGPEAFLYQILTERFPGQKIYIIKAAFSSSAINPDVPAASRPGGVWAKRAGDLYDVVSPEVLKAYQALADAGSWPNMLAMIWIQGESDLPNSAQYAAELESFHDSWNEDHGTSPFGPPAWILARLHLNSPLGTSAQRDQIRSAQTAFAAANAHVVTFSVDNYTFRYDGPGGSNAHYTGFETVYRQGYDAGLAFGNVPGMPGDAPTTELLFPLGDGSGGSGADTGTDDPAADAPSTDAPSTSADDLALVSEIEDAISDGLDVAGYTVNGRTVQMRSIDELLAAHKFFTAQANAKQGLKRTRVSFR
jgi:hypothetical protein